MNQILNRDTRAKNLLISGLAITTRADTFCGQPTELSKNHPTQTSSL